MLAYVSGGHGGSTDPIGTANQRGSAASAQGCEKDHEKVERRSRPGDPCDGSIRQESTGQGRGEAGLGGQARCEVSGGEASGCEGPGAIALERSRS